jgi:hypothetical protein
VAPGHSWRGIHASTFTYRCQSGVRTMAHLKLCAAWPERPGWWSVRAPVWQSTITCVVAVYNGLRA